MDADLACGRHAEPTGELEALVHQHPLRGRLCAQLMLALYRSGRQADAVAAYRAARHVLVEALGIEPSPELRALEAAILRHDVPAPSRPGGSVTWSSHALPTRLRGPVAKLFAPRSSVAPAVSQPIAHYGLWP